MVGRIWTRRLAYTRVKLYKEKCKLHTIMPGGSLLQLIGNERAPMYWYKNVNEYTQVINENHHKRFCDITKVWVVGIPEEIQQIE